MCPSYLATRDEKDSTRGRARVLQEALDGVAGRTGSPTPRSPRRSTSACPARAARRDCPTGVDMATYKAEALHQHVRRPACGRAAHYTLGRLPRWAALAAPMAGAGQPADALRPGRAGWPRPRRDRPAPVAAAVRPTHPAAAVAGPTGHRPTRTCGSGRTRSPTTSSRQTRAAAIRVPRGGRATAPR